MTKQKQKARRCQEYRQFMQSPAPYRSEAERALMEAKRNPLPPKSEVLKATQRLRSKGKPAIDPVYLMAMQMYEKEQKEHEQSKRNNERKDISEATGRAGRHQQAQKKGKI